MSQTVTLKGNPIRVDGDLPATGTLAPALALTATTLAEVTLAD